MNDEETDEEQTYDEQLVELNVVEFDVTETGHVPRDQCPAQVQSGWTTPWLMMMMLATVVCAVYIYNKLMSCAKRFVCVTTRTMGTQSPTTCTRLSRHATPRFNVLPDLLQGAFDEGGRRLWGQVRTLTPRSSTTTPRREVYFVALVMLEHSCQCI